VEPSEHTPQQVSYHDVVLVLTPTVVRMKVDILLTKPMYLKEVMEHAHHCIGPLAHVNCLINEVVDLAWYGFTAHSKDGAEVHRTRLEGVVGVEYLLGHVK